MSIYSNHHAAAALLAKHLEENFGNVVEQGVLRTGKLPSYAMVPPEQLRPGVTVGFKSVLHDLSHPADSQFGQVFGGISERRARQKFEVRDVCSVIQLTEEILSELADHCIAELAVRLPAVRAVHTVCVSARDAIIDSFWKVNQELLRHSEALIRQLSSPLLPIADGIIVLPLLGAVDAARARQLLESLLDGIVTHRAAVAIIDLTAITDVNGFALEQLLKAANAGRLLGAQIILVGISPDVAQVIVQNNADLTGIVSLTDLHAGIVYATAQIARGEKPRGTPATLLTKKAGALGATEP